MEHTFYRASSQRLAEALQCGVEAMGGSYQDFGRHWTFYITLKS